MLLTDTSRTTAINQQFMVTFWYPAVAQAGVLPAKYVEPQVVDCEFTIYGYRGGNFAAKLRRFSHTRCQTRRWRPI